MQDWAEFGEAVLRAALARALTSGPGVAGLADAAAADLSGPQERLAASLEGEGTFALVCRRAGLSAAEAQVLALLVAVEESPARQGTVAVLQEDPERRLLNLGTLAHVLGPEHPGVLTVGEAGRLRRAALVEVDEQGPWGSRSVGVAGSTMWALQGQQWPDPDLPERAQVLRGEPAPTAAGVLHLVSGADVVSRRRRAAEALGGHGLLVTRPPGSQAEWDAVVREATLHGLGVLVEVAREVPDGLHGAVRRADLLAWALSSPDELPLAALPEVPRRDVRVLDGTASEQEWRALTGEPAPLGGRYDRHQLQHVALSADPPGEAVRRLSGGVLDRVTERRRPRRGWADLVLPADLMEQVRALVERHRGRRVVHEEWGFPGLPSRGTVALLAGPSGTGKTLTAEVVAGALGLDLHVLDLSQVVSKYIGETEKNLSELFDAAALGDAVLLFDEADALFGKRTAVTDAKDRYANVEVAYLLQRLEQHDGLVLLATNLPNNMDDAFVRRLHATLEFAVPGPVERRRLWESAFPPGCPTLDLDLDLLAREADLTGAAIASAALSAAFAAAAAADPVVTMERVVDAAAAEYRKRGRLALPPGLRR